jgi:hypothetical protein
LRTIRAELSDAAPFNQRFLGFSFTR